MVEAGLLSEVQLRLALDEQARTQKPLGEVLTSLGFVSAPAMANALAEQHGGPVRTEYGVGTGLAPRPLPPPVDLAARRVEQLERELAAVSAALERERTLRDQAESRGERLAVEIRMLAARIAELKEDAAGSAEAIASLVRQLEERTRERDAARRASRTRT